MIGKKILNYIDIIGDVYEVYIENMWKLIIWRNVGQEIF